MSSVRENADSLCRAWTPPIASDSGENLNFFKIGSHNVQAADMRGPGYNKLDSRDLNISLRLLIDEQFDIICLQELQRCTRRGCTYCISGTCRRDHSKFAHELLIQSGYDGSQHMRNMKRTVGLYYKTEKFDLIDRMRFVNFDWMFDNNKGAVLALLRLKSRPSNVLLVAAVHFSVPLFDGLPDTSKPLQEVNQLFSKIQNIYDRNSGGRPVPTIVAGDFNSISFDPTPESQLAPPDLYRSMLSRGFESAYKSVQGEEPTHTTTEFNQCIDYIFFSPAILCPVNVLSVPSIHEHGALALPAPSDHIPIGVILSFPSI